MAKLSESLQQRIRERTDLWREVCVRSLELLEGTDERVDVVLALYRNPESTAVQFSAAAISAANAAAANAATYAANAANATKGNKVERFIAELEFLVSFAPQQLPEERPHV